MCESEVEYHSYTTSVAAAGCHQRITYVPSIPASVTDHNIITELSSITEAMFFDLWRSAVFCVLTTSFLSLNCVYLNYRKSRDKYHASHCINNFAATILSFHSGDVCVDHYLYDVPESSPHRNYASPLSRNTQSSVGLSTGLVSCWSLQVVDKRFSRWDADAACFSGSCYWQREQIGSNTSRRRVSL